MADPIDQLLNQIQQSETARSSSSSNPSPTPEGDLPRRDSSSSLRQDQPTVQSIDHLLAEVEGKSKSKPVSPKGQTQAQPHSPANAPHQALEKLLLQLDTQVQPATPAIVPPTPNKAKPQPTFPIPLTSQLDAQTEKQQHRKAIVQKAQAWLDALDPHDGNALFFERLAEKYPSRLEAAIDFLGLNQE